LSNKAKRVSSPSAKKQTDKQSKASSNSKSKQNNPKAVSYVERSFDILDSILRQGAYSNIELNELFSQGVSIKTPDSTISIPLISESDKGKITSIVYGMLERIFTIDFLLNKVLDKKPKPVIYNMLRLGAYLIIYFDKIETNTVCNLLVDLAKAKGKGSLGGFINATLRAFAKFIETDYNKEAQTFNSIEELFKVNADSYYSIKLNYPIFAVNKLSKQFGPENAKEILSCNLGNLTHYRSNAEDIQVEQFFSENNIEYIKSGANLGYYARHSSVNTAKINRQFAEASLTAQSLGSIVICLALGVNKSEASILDVCAAPGGKSVYLANKYRDAFITACDIYPHRVELIKKYAGRMSVSNIAVMQNDATVINTDLGTFDYALVDAPCSGFGVTNKKPEIRLKTPESIKDLPKLQGDILNTSANYVNAGGTLVYSTCTYFESENEAVVKKFLEHNKNFVIDYMFLPIPHLPTKEGFTYLLPHISQTEGFFIAKLKRIT
jgi:16S rRNA (cytosine967-C5)-methyltransferase